MLDASDAGFLSEETSSKRLHGSESLANVPTEQSGSRSVIVCYLERKKALTIQLDGLYRREELDQTVYDSVPTFRHRFDARQKTTALQL
jgi:hypothetical protein